MSTSWDGDREEYDMVPLYVLWNAPGGCYDYAGGILRSILSGANTADFGRSWPLGPSYI